MKAYSIGLYEKAMPKSMSWKEKLECARECGYDFVEISIDETDDKLARLEWTDKERLDLVKTMKEVGIPIPSALPILLFVSAAWRLWKKR